MADISLCVSPPSFVLAVFLLAGVSVCQPITRSMYSSLSLCRRCGESYCIVCITWLSTNASGTILQGLLAFTVLPHVLYILNVSSLRSALQSLHKACEVARCHNYFPGSLFLTWVSYYQSRVCSDQARINEWNAMQDVQSHRADSPVLFSDV